MSEQPVGDVNGVEDPTTAEEQPAEVPVEDAAAADDSGSDDE